MQTLPFLYYHWAEGPRTSTVLIGIGFAWPAHIWRLRTPSERLVFSCLMSIAKISELDGRQSWSDFLNVISADVVSEETKGKR
jgi:hypothetical protein